MSRFYGNGGGNGRGKSAASRLRQRLRARTTTAAGRDHQDTATYPPGVMLEDRPDINMTFDLSDNEEFVLDDPSHENGNRSLSSELYGTPISASSSSCQSSATRSSSISGTSGYISTPLSRHSGQQNISAGRYCQEDINCCV